MEKTTEIPKENGSKKLSNLKNNIYIMALFAIFGWGYAIYTDYIRDNAPIVNVDIINNSEVITFSTAIDELKVTYGNQDLSTSNKTLSLMEIRIENQGAESIKNTDFQTGEPFGLKINTGDILRADLKRASNNYLSKMFSTINFNKSQLILTPSVFDPHDFIEINLLIIHPKDTTLDTLHFGKIAGVKSTLKSKTYIDQKKPTFWEQVNSGGIFIILIRYPIYIGYFLLTVIIFVMTVIAIYTVGEKFITFVTNIWKRKKINNYKRSTDDSITNHHEKVFDIYIEKDNEFLARTRKILLDSNRVLELTEKLKSAKKFEADYKIASEQYNAKNKITTIEKNNDDERDIKLAKQLETLGFFKEDGSIDNELKRVAIDFSRFIDKT